MPTRLKYSDALFEKQLTVLLEYLRNGDLTQEERVELFERLNGIPPDKEIIQLLFLGWLARMGNA